jgi:hypothetical protein
MLTPKFLKFDELLLILNSSLLYFNYVYEEILLAFQITSVFKNLLVAYCHFLKASELKLMLEG